MTEPSQDRESTAPSTPKRTAVITGSSRGLGRAMALRLAEDGFRIAVHYNRSREQAAAVVNEIRAAGGEAKSFGADLAQPRGIQGLFEQLDAHYGLEPWLDVLVLNAGVIQHAHLDETTVEQFDRLFAVNVRSVFFGAREGARRLRDGGRLILLGTGLTRMTMPEYIAYASSKGAVDTMLRYLAKELGPQGITVNMVAPGAIETDMNPWLKEAEGQAQIAGVTALGRHGLPGDISSVVSFLASDDSRWVTGQRIEASGGALL